MQKATAKIIQQSSEGVRVTASAARISTTDGSALAIFEKAQGGEKDIKLIRKVLASGHKSVLEHLNLTIAFDNVSVIVEEFMIEARLNAFTVKSRRYVDFSDAGYVIPDELPDAAREIYCSYMDSRFKDYEALLELGIPKEDARYVLPYSFRSNFYMTLNAHTLLQIIAMMTTGRGAVYAELYQLGNQLKQQLEELLPGVYAQEEKHVRPTFVRPLPTEFSECTTVQNSVELLHAPQNPEAQLSGAMAFSGRIPMGTTADTEALEALVSDVRPRELEELNYAFVVHDVSQACITHFVRHRMQSILVPEAVYALASGRHILPETVAQNPEAEIIYGAAFAESAKIVPMLLKAGIAEPHATYCTLSGHVSDIRLNMNARELMHFLKLRTCRRAQWEIRNAAWQMLELLKQQYPALFEMYGPSCRVDGRCPEGRLTCGKPYPKHRIDK